MLSSVEVDVVLVCSPGDTILKCVVAENLGRPMSVSLSEEDARMTVKCAYNE